MKLSQLQEASYAFPNYANWVQDSIDSGEAKSEIEIDKKAVDVILKQLTRRFGQPHKQTIPDKYFIGERREYYLWQNDVESVADTSYDIILWQWGELRVHVYKETDLD